MLAFWFDVICSGSVPSGEFYMQVGTSTAKMLCNDTSFNTKAIWASTLSLATVTGYLRIAADKHYFTDVLVGAIIGSTVGHIAFEKLHRRYKKKLSNSLSLPRFSYSPFNICLFVPLWHKFKNTLCSFIKFVKAFLLLW